MCMNSEAAFGFGIKDHASGTALEYWFLGNVAFTLVRGGQDRIRRSASSVHYRSKASEVQVFGSRMSNCHPSG